ncbi:MAG: CopD family protein [Proteobacteria bacterium]|nr:CopD family protein [Pseudomonadota bacterium]
MTAFTRELLIFLHLLGAIAWFGGMFFAYFCLRPAAAETLDPPKRLPLWAATFGRFLRYTAAAVVVIAVSGLAMLIETGFRTAPTGWLVMTALGLVMMLVFGYVYLALYPRLSTHCLASAWPAAAIVLNDMRRLVAINLVLALCTVAAAVFAR